MTRSKAYYVTRSIVRTVFWVGVGIAAVYAAQFLLLCVWSLQF